MFTPLVFRAQLNAATASNLSIMSQSKSLADSQAKSGAQIRDQNGRAKGKLGTLAQTSFNVPSAADLPKVPDVKVPDVAGSNIPGADAVKDLQKKA